MLQENDILQQLLLYTLQYDENKSVSDKEAVKDGKEEDAAGEDDYDGHE
jgi:hypothetical protein